MNELKHIAIIMDGNGRWAKSRGLTRSQGHIEGAKNIKNIAKSCRELGVKYLSLYAFSTENWKRHKDEVNGLLKLFRSYLESIINSKENNFRLKVIGNKTIFSKDLQEIIRNAEEKTKNNEFTIGVCFNYGGQDEIVDAVNSLIEKGVTHISKDDITNTIYTGFMPPPDMIIRTGKEKRLSNFFLWQGAYSELFFVDTLWPDFGKNELVELINEYHTRTRKFGDAHE